MLLLFACTPDASDVAKVGADSADTSADTSVDTGSTGEGSDLPFYLGVNFPWSEYGIDLNATAWGDYTVTAESDTVRAELAALSAHGARSVRWWFFGDGRATPSFTADGTPLPLDDEALANATHILDLAEEAGLTVMPVLLDFAWCGAAQEVSGVTLGGHADVLSDPAKRAALVEDTITPLAEALADHPALAAWDLMNEPEWAFTGEDHGLGDHCAATDVQAFVADAAAAIAAVGPQPTTVGSGSYAWMVQYWAEATPLLQFHDYWEDLGTLDSDLGRPVLVGEFPTADNDLKSTLDTAWNGNFAGAMPWSGYADDDASALDLDALNAWSSEHAVGGAL